MQLRSFQYFVAAEWTGGIYASPSMPGSRPGGLIAATWAALVRMGEAGYLECARAIMSTAKEIEAGIRTIPGLRVLGHPHMAVVAFAADESTPVRGTTINIYKVGESMSAKRTNADGSLRHGWNLNTLQKPSSIHICCTYMHRGRAKEFLDDLRSAVDQVADVSRAIRRGTGTEQGQGQKTHRSGRVSIVPTGSFCVCWCLSVVVPRPSEPGHVQERFGRDLRHGRVARGRRRNHRRHGARIHRHALHAVRHRETHQSTVRPP